MRLFNNKSVKTIFTVCMIAVSISASAQCKRFTKKNCFPSLAPYTHNGQLTSAFMIPGDSAEVKMTFNAGKDYRLIVCSQELIGKAQFKVLDWKRNVLYTSKEGESNPMWDFSVSNTQQFTIQILVPKKEKSNHKTNLIANGCVSLLIGFQE